jgi:hypothetical protein
MQARIKAPERPSFRIKVFLRWFTPGHGRIDTGQPCNQDREIQPADQLFETADGAGLPGFRHDISESSAGQYGVTEIMEVNQIAGASLFQAGERIRDRKNS